MTDVGAFDDAATLPAQDLTPEVLAERIGANPRETTALTETLIEARQIVAQVIGSATVPDDIARRAVIDTALDLWNARSAPNGVKVFADGQTGVALRVSRDRAATARALLRPWLPVVIA